MKRKIAVVFLLLLIAGVILFIWTGKTMVPDYETVPVESGSFTAILETAGTSYGRIHSLFFSGLITDVRGQVYEKVEKDQVILEYEDAGSRKKELKSQWSGYVKEISEGRVIIEETADKVRTYLSQKQAERMQVGMKGFFSYGEKTVSVLVSSVWEYGIIRNGSTYFVADLNIEGERIPCNLQGNVKIELQREENCLLVDRRAVYERKGIFYLVPKTSNLEDLIEIRVRGINEEKAWIEGTGLAGREVCLIDEELRKQLDH